MRYLSLLALLFVTSACHAGLVYNNALPSTPGSVTIDPNNARGQTFTNGNSAAQMVSVTVYLRNTGSAAGTIKIDIKDLTGTPGSGAIPTSGTGSVVATSATINASAISTTDATAYTFNTFTGSNLAASTSYGFTVNMSGITSGSLTLYYGSPIIGQNSYHYNGSTFTPDNTDDLAGQVDVTAVPEPGTLILTGFALASGGICAWCKRRRKNQVVFDPKEQL